MVYAYIAQSAVFLLLMPDLLTQLRETGKIVLDACFESKKTNLEKSEQGKLEIHVMPFSEKAKFSLDTNLSSEGQTILGLTNDCINEIEKSETSFITQDPSGRQIEIYNKVSVTKNSMQYFFQSLGVKKVIA